MKVNPYLAAMVIYELVKPPLPATSCKMCKRAEGPMKWLYGGFFDNWEEPPSGLGNLYRAMLGAPPRQWEDIHKDNYVRTGNLTELTRMVRHVR